MKTLNRKNQVGILVIESLLVLFLFFSCNKKEINSIENQIVENTDQIASKNNLDITLNDFKFEVIDNVLTFPSVEDYEKAIDYLTQLDNNMLTQWTSLIHFKSIRDSYDNETLETLGFEDELFSSIINPEGIIAIDKYFYLISGGKVYVTLKKDYSGKSSLKSSKSVVFDVDEDVISILYGDTIDSNTSKCDANNTGWQYFYLSGGNVKYRLRYYKAGIYFSVRSIMEKNGTGISMEMGINTNPNYQKSFKKIKKNNMCEIIYGNTGGNSNSYDIRFHSSTHSLIAYNVIVYFTAYDLHNNGTFLDNTLRIKCNEWNTCQ